MTLLLLLQDGRRRTAAELAGRMGVSERTVLRDMRTLEEAGVPVTGVRGPGGGFEVLPGLAPATPAHRAGLPSPGGRIRRVRVRVTEAALERAEVIGRPAGWRARVAEVPPQEGWVEGSFRYTDPDEVVGDLLRLAPDVEVLLPSELRDRVRTVAAAAAARHEPIRTP